MLYLDRNELTIEVIKRTMMKMNLVLPSVENICQLWIGVLQERLSEEGMTCKIGDLEPYQTAIHRKKIITL